MGFLMPKLPKIRVEGARLADLSVTSSAYGETITIGMGTIRLSGNIIWGQKIREEKVSTTSTAGGKGGGGQTTITTEFFYFVHIAIGIAEGTADVILRQFGDGKAFYDVRAGEDRISMDGLVFRFYPGDEDQDPDPLILSFEGEDSTPAYRGLCYIVLEDISLADFGNRIPNWTFEINFEQGQAEQLIRTEGADDAPWKSDAHEASFVDWNRGLIYLSEEFIGPSEEFLKYSLATLDLVEVIDVTAHDTQNIGLEIWGLDQRTGWMVGNFALVSDNESYVWDPASNTIITNVIQSDAETIFALRYIAVITLDSDVGTFQACISTDPSGSEVRAHTFPSLVKVASFQGPAPGNLTPYEATEGANGQAWGFWRSADEIHIASYNLDPTGNVTQRLFPPILKTDLHPTATFENNMTMPTFDRTSGALYLHLPMTGGNNFAVKWTPESGIIFSTDTATFRKPFNSGLQGFTRLAGEVWAFGDQDGDMVTIDIVSGEFSHIDLAFFSEAGHQVWDDRSNCMYNWNVDGKTTQTLEKICPTGQAPVSTDLASIVERVAIAAGLDPILDIEASDGLAVEIPGYKLSSETDGTEALEDLIRMFAFSVAEYDGQVHFTSRGQAVTATINEDEMLISQRRRGGYQPYTEEIEEEIDLPEKFVVAFQNRELDYQSDTRSTSRVLTPDPTIFSTQTFEISAPVVLGVDVAKQQSEILLYQAWNEQVSYRARIPHHFLAMAPGDAVNIALNNGLLVRARAERADIGADFTIKARFKTETTGQFTSAASTESGEAIEQGVKQVGLTKLFMIGGPLLRDVDATNRTATRTYFAGGPLGVITTSWPGMRLFQSIDSGASYEQYGTAIVPIPWGVTRNALADPESFWRYDLVNVVDVAMVAGSESLETVTDFDLSNLRNAAVLFKRNGTHEFFQFRDVTPLGGDVFRLSTLIRGIRGTEVMAAGGHETGEEFCLLDVGALEGSIQDLAAIGVGRFYKAVTLGALIQTTPIETFADLGRDLMPYAPEHPAAAINGVDIDWTWIRRTRVGGALRDLVDVPLSEDTESYELDIFASQASTPALRTLASSSEAVTYADADITTDFGSIPATIWIELYQLSAQVGRGFARRREVEVI